MRPPLAPRVAAAVAATVAELVADGMRGVVLLGSQVRGDATEHSDVDLVGLGTGPEYVLRRTQGLLMSISRRLPDAVRSQFADPKTAGNAVPGWRLAVVLHDPDGLGGALVDEAVGWRWTDIDDRRRAWIADQVTGRAEIVHRLVGSLAAGRRAAAGVSRNKLATRLPVIAAVHHQILYDGEYQLYDLVSRSMGPSWLRCQEAALALAGESLAASSRAALELYALLAPQVAEYLSPEQLAVVMAAADLAWAAQRAA